MDNMESALKRVEEAIKVAAIAVEDFTGEVVPREIQPVMARDPDPDAASKRRDGHNT